MRNTLLLLVVLGLVIGSLASVEGIAAAPGGETPTCTQANTIQVDMRSQPYAYGLRQGGLVGPICVRMQSPRALPQLFLDMTIASGSVEAYFGDDPALTLSYVGTFTTQYPAKRILGLTTFTDPRTSLLAISPQGESAIALAISAVTPGEADWDCLRDDPGCTGVIPGGSAPQVFTLRSYGEQIALPVPVKCPLTITATVEGLKEPGDVRIDILDGREGAPNLRRALPGGMSWDAKMHRLTRSFQVTPNLARQTRLYNVWVTNLNRGRAVRAFLRVTWTDCR
jgi:hypothetical protein